jgi:putative endonuclease
MSLLDALRWRLTKKKSIWTRGEDAAAKLMKQRGCRVLARNLRLSMGEIDILCFDPKTDCIVVVEVKARVRKSDATPMPEASITAAKKRKLSTLAKAVSGRHDCRDKRIRIDVVAVEFAGDQRTPISIRHYESAVGDG